MKTKSNIKAGTGATVVIMAPQPAADPTIAIRDMPGIIGVPVLDGLG